MHFIWDSIIEPSRTIRINIKICGFFSSFFFICLLDVCFFVRFYLVPVDRFHILLCYTINVNTSIIWDDLANEQQKTILRLHIFSCVFLYNRILFVIYSMKDSSSSSRSRIKIYLSHSELNIYFFPPHRSFVRSWWLLLLHLLLLIAFALQIRALNLSVVYAFQLCGVNISLILFYFSFHSVWISFHFVRTFVKQVSDSIVFRLVFSSLRWNRFMCSFLLFVVVFVRPLLFFSSSSLLRERTKKTHLFFHTKRFNTEMFSCFVCLLAGSFDSFSLPQCASLSIVHSTALLHTATHQ